MNGTESSRCSRCSKCHAKFPFPLTWGGHTSDVADVSLYHARAHDRNSDPGRNGRCVCPHVREMRKNALHSLHLLHATGLAKNGGGLGVIGRNSPAIAPRASIRPLRKPHRWAGAENHNTPPAGFPSRANGKWHHATERR